VYLVGGISQPGIVERIPETAMATNVLGTVKMLKFAGDYPGCRIVHVSSDSIFGSRAVSPQSEGTPLNPNDMYAAMKAMTHCFVTYCCNNGQRASNMILFNATSAAQTTGVFAHVCRGAIASMLDGTKLQVDDLNARRDWMFAGDAANALLHIAYADIPGDYVAGRGDPHTVAELCDAAYKYCGLNWQDFVTEGDHSVRDTSMPCADASKLRGLGWTPKFGFASLVAFVMSELVKGERDGG